jgi:hypothetical protein
MPDQFQTVIWMTTLSRKKTTTRWIPTSVWCKDAGTDKLNGGKRREMGIVRNKTIELV